MRQSKKTLITIATVLGAAALFFYGTGAGGAYNKIIINILFLIPPLVATIGGIGAVTAYGITNHHGRAILYITLGLASWFIGETLWAVFDLILHITLYPSAADLFYLIAYPLILVGILTEIQNYKLDVSPVRSMILSVVSIILTTMVFYLSILPAYSSGSTFIANAIAVSYGLGDVILIVGVSYMLMMTLDFKGGKLFYAWLWIMIGIIFMLLGDLFFSMYKTMYDQDILAYKRIDLLWVVSYLSFAVGLFELRFIIKDVQDAIRSQLT